MSNVLENIKNQAKALNKWYNYSILAIKLLFLRPKFVNKWQLEIT